MELDVAGRGVFAATGGRHFVPGQETVVFLHGAGMDHSVWALQTRWFAHHGRNVLALDLPGHGRSVGPPLASLDAMAEFTAALVAGLDSERISLVGHSMGALVALEAASRLDGRIASLALLGFTPAMQVHPDLLGAAARGEHGSIDFMTVWGLGRRAQIGAMEAPGLWMTGATARLLERGDPKTLASDLAACSGYAGAEAAAARVAAKVLLLCGADDRMTPAAKAVPFAGRFRDGRAVVLPKAGHMMMIEDPTATLAALRDAI